MDRPRSRGTVTVAGGSGGERRCGSRGSLATRASFYEAVCDQAQLYPRLSGDKLIALLLV
jgi:hypothetical protein